MSSSALRQTLGYFPVIYRWLEFSKSTWGNSGGSSGVTRASSIREFCEDGWVPCCNKTAIFWWFSVGVVFLLVSYIGLRSSGWVNISVRWVIWLISTYATSCIYLSSRIWTLIFSMLAKRVCAFLGDWKKSDLPSLSPELSANVMPLSGLLDWIFKDNKKYLSDSQHILPDYVCNVKANPSNMKPLVLVITIMVSPLCSHLAWKSYDLHPCIQLLYRR